MLEQFATRDIYVTDSDGGNFQRLTDDEHTNSAPAWSLDGEQIAFVANRDAQVAQPCSYGKENEPCYGIARTALVPRF